MEDYQYDSGQIEVLGTSLVKLHKVLKPSDLALAERNTRVKNTSPLIVIDFKDVSCIQEDYRSDGTIILDKKTAVVVTEKFADVLDAWIEAQENMAALKKKK